MDTRTRPAHAPGAAEEEAVPLQRGGVAAAAEVARPAHCDQQRGARRHAQPHLPPTPRLCM